MVGRQASSVVSVRTFSRWGGGMQEWVGDGDDVRGGYGRWTPSDRSAYELCGDAVELFLSDIVELLYPREWLRYGHTRNAYGRTSTAQHL